MCRWGIRRGGWKEVPNSWKPGDFLGGHASQAAGFTPAGSKFTYIMADSMDRTKPVSVFRVPLDSVTNRDTWQPLIGKPDFGHPEGYWGDIHTSFDQFYHLGDKEKGMELSVQQLANGKIASTIYHPGSGLHVHVANSIGEFITNFGTEAAHIPGVGKNFNEADVPGVRGIFSGYGGYILSAGEHELELLVSQWPGGSNYPYQIVRYRVGI